MDQASRVEVGEFLFPGRMHDSPHLGTRQYARIVGHWVDDLGLDRADYGTHSMRRTKATLIDKRTKKPSCGSAASRALQAGINGEIPRH